MNVNIDNLTFPSGKTVSSLKKQAKIEKVAAGGRCKALDLLAPRNGLDMPWNQAIKKLQSYWAKWFCVYSFRINDNLIVDVRFSPQKRKSQSDHFIKTTSKTLHYELGALFLIDDYDGSRIDIDDTHVRLWSSSDNKTSKSPIFFGYHRLNVKISEWGDLFEGIKSNSFSLYDKSVEYGINRTRNDFWSPIVKIKKELTLRLFRETFPDGSPLLKYLHIGIVDSTSLTINYFTNRVVIDKNPNGYIEQAMLDIISNFNEIEKLGINFSLEFQDTTTNDWSFPWGETKFSGFPTFVGIQCSKTGKIKGGVFFDPHTSFDTLHGIINSGLELGGSAFCKRSTLFLSNGDYWNGLVFSRNSKSSESIDLIMDRTPHSKNGMCAIYLYKEGKWHSGSHNIKSGYLISNCAI